MYETIGDMVHALLSAQRTLPIRPCRLRRARSHRSTSLRMHWGRLWTFHSVSVWVLWLFLVKAKGRWLLGADNEGELTWRGWGRWLLMIEELKLKWSVLDRLDGGIGRFVEHGLEFGLIELVGACGISRWTMSDDRRRHRSSYMTGAVGLTALRIDFGSDTLPWCPFVSTLDPSS